MVDGGGESSDPAHFASEILEVSGEGAVYHLRENTRFWQGHRLLLADDVVYHHELTTVRAAGHVRTTLPASQLELEGSPEEDVVVVARSLDFDQARGRGNLPRKRSLQRSQAHAGRGRADACTSTKTMR